MVFDNKRIAKGLIRLGECTGWSALLLFTNPEDRFSPIEVQIGLIPRKKARNEIWQTGCLNIIFSSEVMTKMLIRQKI